MMTQQTSLRFVHGFGKWAIAATVLMSFALTAGIVSGKAIAAELPSDSAISEMPVSDRAADLGELMQAECVTVTPLQSRTDCPVGGELFLSVDSENQMGETVMRFDLQNVDAQDSNEARSNGVTLFRILF
jgi:hypothetical protein